MLESLLVEPWCPEASGSSANALRLFCFPHAGGSAAVYRSLSRELSGNIQVCPVELPGRERRGAEAPFRNARALVDALVHFLRFELEKGPFALFGHSMGARVAFELTRALARAGVSSPRALIVSGCPAPELVDPRPKLAALPRERFIAALRELNGTPREVLENEELMQLLLPRLRADYALSEGYELDDLTAVDVPLLAVGGSDDPEASVAELEAWRARTSRNFTLRMLPGDHFFLHTARSELAAVLRRELEPFCPENAPAASPPLPVERTRSPIGEAELVLQSPRSIVDLLDREASLRPDRIAFVYLRDGEEPTQTRTYAALRGRARAIAKDLSRLYARGERVVLFFAPGLEFIEAFFGCLYAGLVAVPLPVPRLQRGDEKLRAVLADAAPACVLTDARDLSARDRHRLLDVPVYRIEELGQGASGALPEPPGPDALAYLQYTSGSTSTPKGVMVNHGNVLANCRLMSEAFAASSDDRVVTWLPHFHDLGLVFGLLFPVFCGASACVLPPVAFVHKPVRWLRAISRYRGTLSAAPNFAFDLCNKHVSEEELRELDLSSFRGVINGAEPVRQKSVETFVQRFATAGFAEEAMRPAYGLAEATLVVSISERGSAPSFDALDAEALKGGAVVPAAGGGRICGVANCGTFYADAAIAIVDSESRVALPDGRVGEVWVRGSSVALGYFRNVDATQAVFGATLRDTGEGPYLRTGDLGYRRGGALFIAGRIKDVIIVRGRNYYPQDIEAAVSASHPAFDMHGAAAFAVNEAEIPDLDAERLVVFQELARGHRDEDLGALARVVQKTVSDEFGLAVHAVVFLGPRRLPKTSSGKVQRSACKAAFLAGDSSFLGIEYPQSPAPEERTSEEFSPESVLARALQRTLNIELDEERWQAPLIDLGLESIQALAFVEHVAESTGYELAIDRVLSGASASALAEELRAASARSLEPRAPRGSELQSDPYEQFPLTEVQQAYWVGRRPGLPLSGVGCHGYLEFDAPELDERRFTLALRALIARHEMLRAVVSTDGLQRVLRDVPAFEPEIADLSAYPAAARERALDALREERSHRVFAPEIWPLFGVRIVRLPAGKARIQLDFDLLILDYRSIALFSRDLAALYSGDGAALPTLHASFREHVLAERLSRESVRYAEALAYWRKRAAELPGAPALPLARRPEEIALPRFVRRSFLLAAPAWTALKERARRAGQSASGLVLAAFAEVLARWSEKPAFSLAVTVFDRPPARPEFADLIGDFTAVLPLGIEVSREASFADRALTIQRQLWRDLGRRQVSGVRVLREGVQGGVPALPVVFTSALGGDDGAPFGWLGEEVFSVSQTPQVWLDHQVSEAAGELRLVWDAVDELFPEGMLDAMFAVYTAFLEYLAGDDAIWRSTTPLVLPARQLRVRERANATAAPIPPGLLHDAISEQARLRPDAPAVLTRGATLTFGELTRSSNALARRLRAGGARPNTLVAIALDKSIEQIVAVLAVLKSGAAYLPVDPSLPRERLHEILRQGSVRQVVTLEHFALSLEWPAGAELTLIDGSREEPVDDNALEPVQTNTDLAYVIFTSGSTGKPKGVMIDHRGALNTIAALNRRFQVSESDRVLALSALSFDLSVYDVFGVLGAGGALVLPDPALQRDPEHWAELMEEHGVTLWNSVPALMEMLVESVAGRRARLPGALRLAFLSGDWIPVSLPERIRALCSDVELVSLGGATEASIWSILYPIREVDPSWKSIPYGKPLENQTFHVLDASMEPCPEWVPGRLYIGGVGVALGYFGDVQRTRERFIVHPRSAERLYLTGDLGRYLPDGNIEFLGREDLQVKVQGYRIELEEIEAALLASDRVQAAAVLALDAPSGGKRLVGYVVPREGAAQDPQALKSLLAERLPTYMVPATWCWLSSLPLTANGKVDRQSLSKLGVTQRSSGAPASSEHAERFRTLIGELLKLPDVTLDQNFFALGGDSLLATRLSNQVRESWGVELPLRSVFEHPVLIDLLGELLRSAPSSRAPVVVNAPMESVPGDESFPLTDVQSAYFLGRSSAFPLGGVACQGYIEIDAEHLDVDRLRSALARLTARHAMLRAVVTPEGRQRILPEAPLELPVLDLRGASPEERTLRLERERERASHAMLPADRAPLFRIALIRLSDALTRVQLNVDLLVMDSFSFRLFARELNQLYHCPGADLEPLGFSFREYVTRAKQLETTREYGESLEYWRERAQSLPAAPALPLVRDPAAIRGPRFTRRTQRLAPELWRTLKQRARSLGLTPSGAVLAAFAEILGRFARSPHFTLNVTLFNREPVHDDVNRVLGDFTTVTLLAVESTEPTFSERARSLQKRLWQDLDHRRVSGVRVLGELSRLGGSRAPVTMPVVFTSTLQSDEEPGAAPLAWLGREVFAVSQTPQVFLDHQVGEDTDGLFLLWDAVEELFPPGLLDSMFAAYGELLRRLAEEPAFDRASDWVPTLPPAEPEPAIASRDSARLAQLSIENALLREPAVLDASAERDPRSNAREHWRVRVVEQPGAVRGGRDIVIDPLARLGFKQQKLGLRGDLESASIRLARPELDADRIKRLVRRRSYRNFAAEPLPLERLGSLLGVLLQEKLPGLPLAKSLYGSAGGLYPVQAYLYAKPGRVSGLEAGAYYYHPERHELVQLRRGAFLGPEHYPGANAGVFAGSAFALYLVADARAIEPLYGAEHRSLVALEAGIMTQLLESSAPEHAIGLCQIGAFDFDAIRACFALSERHFYIHGVLGGPTRAEDRTLEKLAEELAPVARMMPEARWPANGAPAQRPERDPRRALELVEVARRALGRSDAEIEIEFASPRDSSRDAPVLRLESNAASRELEEELLRLWRELLKNQQVGREDHFFEAGGTSLLLVQLANRIRDELRREVSVIALFEAPTVRQQVAYLCSLAERAPAASEVNVNATASPDANQNRRDRLRRARLDLESEEALDAPHTSAEETS
jgi:nonribosomal peptide synthetase protein BlmIV